MDALAHQEGGSHYKDMPIQPVEFIPQERHRLHGSAMADLREKCKHWDTKHHGDPSGGNDSHTECLICGKQW